MIENTESNETYSEKANGFPSVKNGLLAFKDIDKFKEFYTKLDEIYSVNPKKLMRLVNYLV